MRYLFLILFTLFVFLGKSQTVKINYWTWSSNHLKQEPQKWNRIDFQNYMPRYYNNFGVSFSFSKKGIKWQRSNYFLYKEGKRTYKFIF